MTKIEGKIWTCPCCSEKAALQLLKEHYEELIDIPVLDDFPQGSLSIVIIHETRFRCEYCHKKFDVKQVKEHLKNLK